jgi:hypothetical protein
VTIAPTINFNTVKASQQNLIQERINQRELLFQTIVDIANNKEIQRIILKSQMSRGIFPTSEFPVVTKNQLRQMYLIGLVLSKVISKSRIQSSIGKYQFNNQKIQQELNDVIEKDITLNGEITQLSTLKCDCEENNNLGDFPSTICGILGIIAAVSLIIAILIIYITSYLFDDSFLPIPLSALLFISICAISFNFGGILKCSWVYTGPFL